MKGNGRRDKTRRYIILTLYIVAVLFAVAAVVYEPNRAFYAAIAGYDMLFLVSYFVTSLAQNVPNSGKYMLLSFSVCLLFAVIIALLYLLFFTRMKEAKTEVTEVPPEEIRIPSAPQVMGTVWIMDDASPHLQDASESEATPTDTDEEPVLVIPADDAEDTTLLTDDSQIKAEDTAIPEDSTLPESADFIDIPDVPVFTEAIIKTEEITADVVLVPPETEKISEVPSTPTFTETILTLDKTTATVSLITFPDKPFMLEPIMEIGEAKLPSAPSLIEPIATISDEIIPVIAPDPQTDDSFFSGLTPEEADFWADFYIAGEDELELADGIYYMDLYVNDSLYGEITTLVQNGKLSIFGSELSNYLSGTLTEAAYSRIFLNRGEYISLDELNLIGVVASFDPGLYEVHLTFDLQDMPIQILSLRGDSSRYIYRPIADGINLDPAVFSLISRYTFNADVRNFRGDSFLRELNFSFTSSNYARLYDVYLDFSYYMYFTPYSFRFNFGSYRFYVDFPEKMLRLSWGNINSEILSPSGTAIGVRIEKNLAYANPTRRSLNYSNGTEQLVVVEKRSDVEVFNEGKSIFKRTLDPGTYQLRDFILYTGANRILIRISPLDGTLPQEIELDVLYSSSLLAPGEFYYGAAVAMSRSLHSTGSDNEPGVLYLPLWNNTNIEYDFRDVTLSGFFRAGLSKTLTLDLSMAIQNRPEDDVAWKPKASAVLELTNLTRIGTTKYNIDIDEDSDEYGMFTLPSISLRASHQISFDIPGLSSMTIGAGYYTPEDWNWKNLNMLSLNASFSGSYGIFGWSLSSYGSLDMSDIRNYSWTISSSVNLSLSRNVYLSASAGFTGSEGSPVAFNGRISAVLRFGRTGITTSTSGRDINTRINTGLGNHSVSANMRSPFITDFGYYELGASYGYSGERLGVNVDVNASDSFKTVGAGISLSTSTIFADGLLAITGAAPSNYLLVHQSGALKGNKLSIGTVGSSSSDYLPMTFGTGLYTGIPSYRSSGVSIYSVNEDDFGTSQNVNVNINASSRNGYILRIDADARYTVSGVVETNENIWTNGSSPVYFVTIEDDTVLLSPSDYYIFTDSDGRFVLSNLTAGFYGFDVQKDNGEWMLFIFEVADNADEFTLVQNYEHISAVSYVLPEPYTKGYAFSDPYLLTSSEFFKMLYPEMKEAV